ncbi:MAG: hypothetical protein AAF728_12250 [Cyanobacteria bacterium P01_D01_bin.128]
MPSLPLNPNVDQLDSRAPNRFKQHLKAYSGELLGRFLGLSGTVFTGSFWVYILGLSLGLDALLQMILPILSSDRRPDSTGLLGSHLTVTVRAPVNRLEKQAIGKVDLHFKF